MMKSIVLMCLVSVIFAAEVDFKHRSNAVGGRSNGAIHVPVLSKRGPAGPISNQQKRQVDFDSSSRPGAVAARQQPGVPLQQPFRPPSQVASNFRQRPQPAEQQNSESSPLGQRGSAGVPSSFAPQSSSEQLFAPLRDSAESPARQQRPSRPSATAASGERFNKNPEFAAGFPAGFTSGLPSFDFQGRMPEPDGKSEGFMDGVLNNFPNLKSLGGFDAFPDVGREDDSNKRQQIQAPVRPPVRPNNPQKTIRSRRAAANSNVSVTALKNGKLPRKNRPIVLEDDEAMLEPDVPSVNKRSGKEPTDIADIIADSAGSEQRFNPTFHPNNGPYGRFPAPSIPPATNGRTRRPTTPAAAAAAAAGPSGNNRQAQRTPYANQFEFVDDNSLLGSGNFDVLGGGVFRDTTDYRPYINSNAAQFYPPSPPTQDTFRPNQQFYPLGQPPSQQLGNFAPQPIQQNQPPAYNTPSYPTSFFDDDFFSNFRDFADVNQDYRN